MFNRPGKNKHTYYLPDLKKKVSIFAIRHVVSCVFFHNALFVIMFPSIPNLLEVFTIIPFKLFHMVNYIDF